MVKAAKARRKPGRKKGNVKGRTAPGPLTPTGGNHREATETAARLERRRQAWHLYVYERLPVTRIAEILTARGLPCIHKTVLKDLHDVAAEARQDSAATMRHGLDIELQRLDQMDRQLLPLALGQIEPDRVRVTTGRGKSKRTTTMPVPVKSEPRTRLQLEAIEKLRRNGESRRKLLGLDKQPDAGTVAIEQVVQAVRGLIGDVLSMALGPDERRQLADSMRRRFGVIEAEVVERE